MGYDMPLWRPPSEAESLIIQATLGCSHNACSFCTMYRTKRFQVRSLEEVEQDLEEFAPYAHGFRRVFLADGDALAADTDFLLSVMAKIYQRFPWMERITAYAGPKDIVNKSPEELRALCQAGLTMLYLGLESGSEAILRQMHKGATPAQMVEAAAKAKEAGIDLSVTVILGLGGRDRWEEHARETARVLNQMDPPYLGALTLMVPPDTPLAGWVERGEFQVPGPLEIAKELRLLIVGLSLTNCVFRTNHASNYLLLAATLKKDGRAQAELLKRLDQVIAAGGTFRPEGWRGL